VHGAAVTQTDITNDNNDNDDNDGKPHFLFVFFFLMNSNLFLISIYDNDNIIATKHHNDDIRGPRCRIPQLPTATDDDD
jgi:hypothetical protein